MFKSTIVDGLVFPERCRRPFDWPCGLLVFAIAVDRFECLAFSDIAQFTSFKMRQ
jgi:hypothetical protein